MNREPRRVSAKHKVREISWKCRRRPGGCVSSMCGPAFKARHSWRDIFSGDDLRHPVESMGIHLSLPGESSEALRVAHSESSSKHHTSRTTSPFTAGSSVGWWVDRDVLIRPDCI